MYHYGSAVTCVCYIQLAHKEESHNSSAATRYSVIYAFFLDDVILSAKTYKKIMCAPDYRTPVGIFLEQYIQRRFMAQNIRMFSLCNKTVQGQCATAS